MHSARNGDGEKKAEEVPSLESTRCHHLLGREGEIF